MTFLDEMNCTETLLSDFCKLINQTKEEGSVLEFGTGSGWSAVSIAKAIPNHIPIVTFDGFIGLPVTKKIIPKNTDWFEGNYCFNEKETRKVVKPYSNVKVYRTMLSKIKIPSKYGISKIVAVNMDLDLYEGSLDALNFIEKCEWKTLILRFDDWGCYSHQIAEQVNQHEKAAFFDWIKSLKYQVTFTIKKNCLKKTNGRQAIIIVKR